MAIQKHRHVHPFLEGLLWEKKFFLQSDENVLARETKKHEWNTSLFQRDGIQYDTDRSVTCKLKKKMFAYLFSSTQVQSQELIDDIFVGISVG